MRDFQEFVNEKIAVSCSSAKENIDFVKLCCKNGFKLGRPDCMDIFDKNKLWTVGRIFKDEIFNDNNDKSFLSEYKIVQASEFLQPQATIEIFQSKQTVVCLKKQGNKVVAVGKARYNPDDEKHGLPFVFKIGSDLAYQRMNDDEEQRKQLKPPFDISDYEQGIKTLKNGIRIKKQDVYEVGDRVLIKKEWKSYYKKSLSGPNAISLLNSVRKITGASGEAYLVPTNNDSSFYILGKDIKGKVIS